MVMHNGMVEDEFEEQPSLTPPVRVPKGGKVDLGSMKGTILVSAVVTIVILTFMTIAGGVGLVTKKDFTANIQEFVTTVETAKSELEVAKTDAENAIKGIPAIVSSQVVTQVAGQLNTLSTTVGAASGKVDTMTTTVQNLNTTVTQANARIATLTEEIASLKANDTDYEHRLLELESPTNDSSSTGGDGSDIPNVAIDVKVTDEGTFHAIYGESFNITESEFKMTFVNNGLKDIEDIVLYVYIIFDNSEGATQGIISSSYGSWSIRERQREEVQLKGRLSRLEAGESRRIYITMVSSGNDNGTTYIDVGDSDVEIIDWNYE